MARFSVQLRFNLPRLVAAAIVAHAALASAQGIGSHLSVGTVAGEAAGLDDGYVHFGGFVPIAQPDSESLWFAEGSLLLFNEDSDQLGGNVGIGYRSLCDTTGTILGGYAYYDRRDLGLDEFDQLGVGVESMGELFDARLNVNVPLTDTQATTVGFTTIDAELGALLTEQGWAACRSYVGVYGLLHDEADSTAGVRGRLELRIADQCYVGGYVEHDDVFQTTGGFTFEYRFGRSSSASDDASQTLLARLGDRVNRRRHVVVANKAAIGLAPTAVAVPAAEPEAEPPVVDPPTVDPPATPEGEEERPGRPYRPPPRPRDPGVEPSSR